MAKQKKSQLRDSKVDESSFQKMIKASKEAKDRLVFDKTKVNK